MSDPAPSPLFDLLFTSAHLELLHAATQDIVTSAHIVRIVNFLIGHCCILTIYYFHILFKPFGTRAFLFCKLSDIQDALL